MIGVDDVVDDVFDGHGGANDVDDVADVDQDVIDDIVVMVAILLSTSSP